MKYEKGSFVVIPNKQHLRGCPAEMQSIYFWICEHADNDGQCFPTRKTLARESGVNIKTLSKYIKLLVDRGFLSVVNRVNNFTKEKTSNLYQILLVDTKGGVGPKTDLGRVKNGPTPRVKNGPRTISSINSKHLTENLSIFNSLKKNSGLIKQKLRIEYINNNILVEEEEIEEIMQDLYTACETKSNKEVKDLLLMFGLQ
jgi:hypothetical protein